MMDMRRNFTIRTRMPGAIARVVALLTAVGGAGLWGLGRVTDRAAAFIFASHAEVVLLSEQRRRTEQAASSLQQTASSLEQLTGTVKHGVDAARGRGQVPLGPA